MPWRDPVRRAAAAAALEEAAGLEQQLRDIAAQLDAFAESLALLTDGEADNAAP